MRAVKPATRDDLRRIERAVTDLRTVRDELKLAGAVKAADYVRRALKSAEGAARHVSRRVYATPLLETCPSSGGCQLCPRHDGNDPCCTTHCKECAEGACR